MLTRRDFLKTTVVGGTSLAAMGLVGCSSSSSSSETSVDESSEATAGNFNENGYPIVNETITLNVMLHIRDSDSMGDPNEMPAIQRLEEMTGVHVEWEVIKDSDWDTKINLAFASDEYPDIIFGGVDDEEYGVTQGIVIPLDNLIEKYMPTYVERRDAEEDDPTISLIASDDQIYSVGYVSSQSYNVSQYWFINQDWMDALGLDTPTDIDGLTEVFRAFKHDDPNGNGEADEVPLELGLDIGFNGIRYILPLFELPCDGDLWIYIDDNKQVQFTPVQEEFRECMEWLHMLYEEGLVDAELLSQDYNTLYTKLQEGNVGFFSSWRLVDMSMDEGVAASSVLWTPEKACFGSYLNLAEARAYITKTNENVEASMRWLDSMLETEMMVSLYYGEEGEGWEYDDDGKIVTGASSGEDMTYLGTNGMFWAPGNYFTDTFVLSESKIEKKAFNDAYDEAGLIQKYSNDYLKMAPLTSDQRQELTLTETDINNAVWEYIATFISNGVTDEKWQEFTQIFENIGVDEYIQVYQDALDTMDL